MSIDNTQIELYVRDSLEQIDEYTTYYNNDFNKKVVEGMPFKDIFENAAISMCRDFLEMRNAPMEKYEGAKLYYWFSVYTTGESHCLHQHPSTAVAGTYYPYADEDSTPIRFRNPASDVVMMSEPYAKPDLIRWDHRPETGDILVWPPWLEHQVGAQKEIPYSRARIAISFNYGRPVCR